MRKSHFLRVLLLLLLTVSVTPGLTQTIRRERTLSASLTFGMGLPKIPFSEFRTPISVLGGASIHVRLVERLMAQLSGYGLYSFSLGTVNIEGTGDLKFNLLYTDADMLYRILSRGMSESFVAGGIGIYNLNQQFNLDVDKLTTLGMNIGIVQWSTTRRMKYTFEVKWHLLFKPSPTPQVLTLTFGFLL